MAETDLLTSSRCGLVLDISTEIECPNVMHCLEGLLKIARLRSRAFNTCSKYSKISPEGVYMFSVNEFSGIGSSGILSNFQSSLAI